MGARRASVKTAVAPAYASTTVKSACAETVAAQVWPEPALRRAWPVKAASSLERVLALVAFAGCPAEAPAREDGQCDLRALPALRSRMTMACRSSLHTPFPAALSPCAGICEHKKIKSQCKECGGPGICEHKRRRSRCKDCGGSGICEHGQQVGCGCSMSVNASRFEHATTRQSLNPCRISAF
jgi:hypothetical protein